MLSDFNICSPLPNKNNFTALPPHPDQATLHHFLLYIYYKSLYLKFLSLKSINSFKYKNILIFLTEIELIVTLSD